MKTSVVLWLGIICTLSTAQLRERRSSPQPSEITVTLKFDWNVSAFGKPIPASYVTNVQNGTVLLDILNKAAGDDKQGPFNKYDSTYYGGLGYLITAMNGMQATNHYWVIVNEQPGRRHPCGVSFYVPRNNSTTIFRFIKHSPSQQFTQNVSGYCIVAPPNGQVPPSAITVTIELDWNVTSVGKPIPAPYTTKVSNGTVLLDILNRAANENTQGPFNKYTSTYHGGLGHSITSMNGIKQDTKTSTYWAIYDKETGKLTPLGVDQYKPQNGSSTIFRLVKFATDESTTGSSETESEHNSGSKFVGVGVGLVCLCLLAGMEGLLLM